MLEHLTADVEAQVGGVHHAPDEAEVVGHQVLAVLHDHDAGGVELQALLVVLGVEVIGGLGGDVEQGLVGDGALDADRDVGQGLFKVIELVLVEAVVLLVGHVLLGLLPHGDHGVQGGELGVGLPLGGLLLAVLVLFVLLILGEFLAGTSIACPPCPRLLKRIKMKTDFLRSSCIFRHFLIG